MRCLSPWPTWYNSYTVSKISFHYRQTMVQRRKKFIFVEGMHNCRAAAREDIMECIAYSVVCFK